MSVSTATVCAPEDTSARDKTSLQLQDCVTGPSSSMSDDDSRAANDRKPAGVQSLWPIRLQ